MVRKVINLNQKEAAESMEYPYNYVISSYGIVDIIRPILVETEQADPGNFPKNIKEHYWVYQGMNDCEPWHSIGILTNGNYFYYTASCDYTGFDCQGEMRLWVTSNYDNLLKYALSPDIYKMYYKETVE